MKQKESDAQAIMVKQIETKNQLILKDYSDINILNMPDAEKVSGFVSGIHALIKDREAQRLEFTKPLNQSLRAINATFKKLNEPLVELKKELNAKLTAWQLSERERVRKEQERIAKEEARRNKIQEAHKKKGHEVSAPIVLAQPADAVTNVGSTFLRKTWTWSIDDIYRVPDTYLILDTVAVNKAVRAGIRKIDGIDIYQIEEAVTR